MIDLLLAIACSALFSILLRLSEGRIRANVTMLTVNYLVCLLLAGSYMGFDSAASGAHGLGAAVAMGVANGCLYPMSFALLQYNIKRNGVVLSAIFMKLGLLVPLGLSICCFGEHPTLLQIGGACLAMAAVILLRTGNPSGGAAFKAGLVLLPLVSGSCDAMSKIFEELGNTALSEQFLFCTFLVAFLLGGVLALCRKERPGLADFLYGLAIGVPNYFSARFLLGALKKLPAVIVYPSFSVAALVVVTLVGVFCFRERLSRRQWCGVVAILAGLVLLNL